MSEFIDNETELTDTYKEEQEQNKPTEIPTDVKDVCADDIVKMGSNEFPVFNCSKDEFFNNMNNNRKRLRFKTGSKVQQYMQGTRYKNRDFYISYTDDNGKTYRRRIK